MVGVVNADRLGGARRVGLAGGVFRTVIAVEFTQGERRFPSLACTEHVQFSCLLRPLTGLEFIINCVGPELVDVRVGR